VAANEQRIVIKWGQPENAIRLPTNMGCNIQGDRITQLLQKAISSPRSILFHLPAADENTAAENVVGNGLCLAENVAFGRRY
jgi:hypothetical protein